MEAAHREPRGRWGARRPMAGAGALALVVWCAWASGFHRGTVDAQLTWLASLAGVVGLWVVGRWRAGTASRERGEIRPAPGPGGEQDPTGTHPWRRAWPWGALAVVVLVWEVLGLVTGPHEPHLTISALAQAFRALDAAVLAVWILVGVLTAAAVTWGNADRWGRHSGRSPTAGPGLATVLFVALPAGVLEGSSRAAGVAFWLGALACGIAIEVAARATTSCLTFPALLRLLWARPAVRVLMIAAWVVAGWHLFSH